MPLRLIPDRFQYTDRHCLGLGLKTDKVRFRVYELIVRYMSCPFFSVPVSIVVRLVPITINHYKDYLDLLLNLT